MTRKLQAKVLIFFILSPEDADKRHHALLEGQLWPLKQVPARVALKFVLGLQLLHSMQSSTARFKQVIVSFTDCRDDSCLTPMPTEAWRALPSTAQLSGRQVRCKSQLARVYSGAGRAD